MRKILLIVAIVLLFVASSTYAEVQVENLTDQFKLEQGYWLHMDNINASARTVTLQLTKNHNIINEQIVPSGTRFNLYNSMALIAQGELSQVFVGEISEAIFIRNLTQYDQVTGKVILFQEKIILGRSVLGSSISGFKINDTNSNGKWDAGEKGISNWTIKLIGITGTGEDTKVIRKETFTDDTGFYKFDNLPSGRYFVIEKQKKGFVPSDSPTKRIKLAQSEISINNNFTNRPVHNQEIDSQRDVNDYEAINKDINEYKKETD